MVQSAQKKKNKLTRLMVIIIISIFLFYLVCDTTSQHSIVFVLKQSFLLLLMCLPVQWWVLFVGVSLSLSQQFFCLLRRSSKRWKIMWLRVQGSEKPAVLPSHGSSFGLFFHEKERKEKTYEDESWFHIRLPHQSPAPWLTPTTAILFLSAD